MKRADVDKELERLAREIERVWGGHHVVIYQEFNVVRIDEYELGSWCAKIINPGDHETSVSGARTRLGAMRELLRVAKDEAGST